MALPTSMLAASSRRRSETESLSATAYRRIKEKIVSLELPPASLIDESALVKELEIGLTPVRQALRQLAMKNLVVILPRRGTIVADLNLSDLQKIFEIRIELETLAAKLAARRATLAQIEAMERLVEESALFLESGDNQQLLQLDHRLHILIAEAAHNEFLEETLDSLYSHVLRLWNLSIERVSGLDQAMEEHRQMVALIKAGESQRVGEMMREHVNRFQRRFLDTI